jgi:DNA-binding NtrC family response regulator
VLITGEPGVGKELASALIHRWSRRGSGPYVAVNAACLSPSLVESELFGHESGAFTGASRTKRGLFEMASGGTLFLDEIGDLPLELQAKLLRVLEGHSFRRLGGEREILPDVRLVCATNRSLEESVRPGRFRPDLLMRLRVLEIELPPLRERIADVRRLALHFVAKLGAEMGLPDASVSGDALELMSRYSWPGNVRELRNVLERGLVLSRGEIAGRHLPPELRLAAPGSPSLAPLSEPGGSTSLAEAERRHVLAVYQNAGQNLTRAAKTLEISRVSLRKRLRAYGI